MLESDQKKIWGMLGLARRAGKIAGGAFQAENAIKSGKACLVILAEDASDNTGKHFRDMCSYRNIRCLSMGDKEQLGKCAGFEMRSVLAVTDASMAEAVLKLGD